jgi:hypothetical protein
MSKLQEIEAMIAEIMKRKGKEGDAEYEDVLAKLDVSQLQDMLDETEWEPPAEKPECELLGHDGNVFNIMGRTIKVLQRAGYPKWKIDEYVKDAKSGDYDHAIFVTGQWVEIV